MAILIIPVSVEIPDGLTVKPIPKHSGYCASPDGRIWSLRQPFGQLKLMTANVMRNGRLQVTLSSGKHSSQRYVHQLILEIYGPPKPPGTICRHLNDDPSDNHISNLRWGTMKENWLDAERNGLRNRATLFGGCFHNAKLNRQKADVLRKEYAKLKGERGRLRNGELEALARKYDLSPSGILCCVERKTWMST